MTPDACPSCGVTLTPTAVTRPLTLPVFGESVTASAPFWVCPACGADRDGGVPLLDRQLRRVYAVYRTRHGLLTPHGIRRLRRALGLSRHDLAQTLGWPVLALQRYEMGALHTPVEDTALRAVFRVALHDRLATAPPVPPTPPR